MASLFWLLSATNNGGGSAVYIKSMYNCQYPVLQLDANTNWNNGLFPKFFNESDAASEDIMGASAQPVGSENDNSPTVMLTDVYYGNKNILIN